MPEKPAARPWANWAIVLGLLLASVLAQVFLRREAGLAAGMLAILPVVVAAWVAGIWGGIAMVGVNFLLEIFLSSALGSEDWSALWTAERVIGLGVSALVAFLVGYVRERDRRHGQTVPARDRTAAGQGASGDFMSLLNDIVRASLEAEDMPSVLDILVNRIGVLFGADDVLITRWDEARHQPELLAAYGSLSETYSSIQPLPDERSITGSVLETGHAIAIEDAFNTPYLSPSLAARFPSRTLLGLPLVVSGRTMGAVILGYDKPHSFSEEEIARGELAAHQISLAMTKVILLEEARQRVRELAGLHQIAQTFFLHSEDHQVYGHLAEILAGLLDAKICAISLYDEASGELRGQIPAFGVNDELVQAFHYPAESRQPGLDPEKGRTFKADRREDIPAEYRPLADTFGIEMLLIAHLYDTEKNLMGAIYAANKKGGFGDEDVRLMEIFTSQVAVVIQNTRLLSAERRRVNELTVLHAVAVAATDADNEDELLGRTARLIGEKLYPEYFSVLLLDEKEQELYVHSCFCPDSAEVLARIPLGIGIPGSVAASGKARRVDDVGQAPEHLNPGSAVRSVLCVPLKIEDQVIGVVDVESSKLQAFCQADEELLGILAGQLSTAIQRLRTDRAERYQTTQMEHSSALIKALAQVGTRAATAADPDGVLQTLGTELGRLGLTCLVALAETRSDRLSVRYTSMPEKVVKTLERLVGRKIETFSIVSQRLDIGDEKVQRPRLIEDPTRMLTALLPDYPRRVVMQMLQATGVTTNVTVCQLPLVSEGRPLGVLWLWGEGLREADIPAMSILASQTAAALQNANLLAEVRRLAITDELTGIFNRRHFFNLAEKEFAQARRYDQPLSALILDIDHFKQFNDRYGHLIGDEVLREVARRLHDSLRDSDILGRYGGEEFSILFHNTNLEAATHAAERLHARVVDAPIQTPAGPLTVQMSIGVTCVSKETPTLQALIQRADQAMYTAKGKGRNRVASK